MNADPPVDTAKTDDREIGRLAQEIKSAYSRVWHMQPSTERERGIAAIRRQTRAAIAAPNDESRADQIVRMQRDVDELKRIAK